jgi:hypothetical protein
MQLTRDSSAFHFLTVNELMLKRMVPFFLMFLSRLLFRDITAHGLKLDQFCRHDERNLDQSILPNAPSRRTSARGVGRLSQDGPA